MNIIKCKKLLEEISGYAHIHSQQLQQWDLQICQYEGPGEYRDVRECGKIDPGMRWGKTGDTGFFSKLIAVPEYFQGYAVYLEVVTGGEAQVFLSGEPYQGNDPNHYRVLLTGCASGGETYDVMVESYVRRSQNEIGEYTYDKACTGDFMQADLCAVDLEAQELLWDLQFAVELAQAHPQYQFAIENALSHMFAAFDISSQQAFLAYVPQGRQYIAQQLDSLPEAEAGKTLWMIGQSHLDLAWFWRKGEACRKVGRTFSTALRNMERSAQSRFMMPQVKLYQALKEFHPALFQQVQKRVAEGRWELAGQMYVEPDTNLISGEWLVRQILYGRKFYQQTFAQVPEIESLIDAFGYSGNLPQILKKSGMSGVVVTKMMWYNDTNLFPYSAFRWNGIDGSSILAATMPWFNRGCAPLDAKENLEKNLQPTLVSDIPVFYGWGDGGGGADETHLAGLERLIKWYKPANVVSGTLSGYFSKLSEIEAQLPVWWGEIYQEGHRGCYTSQGRNKTYNMQSERLYRALEFLMGIERSMGGKDNYPLLEENIELILLNQFHDILPGSAATQVYADSWKEYEKILGEGKGYLAMMLQRLAARIAWDGEGTPIVLWNFNHAADTAVVKIDWPQDRNGRLLDSAGHAVPYVIEDGKLTFAAHALPSFGYAVYRFIQEETAPQVSGTLPGNRIENEWYLVQWNETGALERIYDKLHDRELLKAGGYGNRLTLYFDYPKQCDAWDLEPDYREHAQTLCANEIEAPRQDAVKQSVTMRYRTGSSTIVQRLVLYNGLGRIDFETQVDWHETHKLLRAEFDVDMESFQASYDIPFGVMERAAHCNNSYQKAMFEVPALSFADLSEGNYGAALISAEKYGFSVLDGRMGISLLRSPTFPDPEADQGTHIFSYSFYGHQGGFREGGVVAAARGVVHPVIGMACQAGNGNLPLQKSFLHTDCDNVIIETLKGAQQGEGLILRLYETYGQSGRVCLSIDFPVQRVEACNLAEEPAGEQKLMGNQLTFRIRPFEIKTFRLYL